MAKHELVTPEKFASEMDVLISKGRYPLEFVSFIDAQDDLGQYFVPQLTTYMGDSIISGDADGYPTRAEALAFVGRCWDSITEKA